MKKLHKLINLRYIPEETSLMFNGQRLDKNKTLDDYNILYESENKLTFTVNFERRKISGTTFPIFIKSLVREESLKIEVSSFDFIEMIKYDISLLEGLNYDYRLIFAGKMLEEGYTLGDYSIQKGSTFHAVLRLKG